MKVLGLQCGAGGRGQAAGEMDSPILFLKQSKGMFINDFEEISLVVHR